MRRETDCWRGGGLRGGLATAVTRLMTTVTLPVWAEVTATIDATARTVGTAVSFNVTVASWSCPQRVGWSPIRAVGTLAW
jgi:hypothetical protein